MQRLRRNISQLGWWNAGFYFLARALRPLGCRLFKYELVAQPVGATDLARGRGKAIEVRLATRAEELPAPYPRPAHVVADRFTQGAVSLQAWKGEQATGYLWLVAGRYNEDEVRVVFQLPQASAVWDFDVYVEPDFRLGPTYLRLWEEANRWMLAREVRWTVSRIDAFNVASKQAHGRLGARKLAGAVFLCCGRWQASFTSCAPYFHLSSGPARPLHLRLDTGPLDR